MAAAASQADTEGAASDTAVPTDPEAADSAPSLTRRLVVLVLAYRDCHLAATSESAENLPYPRPVASGVRHGSHGHWHSRAARQDTEASGWPQRLVGSLPQPLASDSPASESRGLPRRQLACS